LPPLFLLLVEIKMSAIVAIMVMMIRIVFSFIHHLRLKRCFVVDCFRCCSVLEYAFVDPDELDGVAQDLECGVVIPFLVRPLALVKNAGNGDAIPFFEIFAANFRQLVESDHSDPACFLFRGRKGDVKGCDGHSVR